MSEVIQLHAVEVKADPQIADMVFILEGILEKVREGNIVGFGAFLISKDYQIEPQWAFTAKKGHACLLAAGASRFLHDINTEAINFPDQESGDDTA